MAKPRKTRKPRKPRKVLKRFDDYIEGDEELRKLIFSEPPATQQALFDLFSALEHVYFGFFLFYCSIPSTAFWEVILSQLSSVASGTARNRNFCDNPKLLWDVVEEPSPYSINRDKIVDLVGASHGLWFELSDPNYKKKPCTLELWTALMEADPGRIVWEWWFEAMAREAKELYERHLPKTTTRLDPYVENIFEEWAHKKLGLLRPRAHWFCVVREFLAAYELASEIKHKIARPYFRLVYTITKNIAAHNQPEQFLDTFQHGVCGLMRGVAKYAPSMALAFPTFVEKEIRYEIYYRLSNYNLVALPSQTWQKHREFEGLKKDYVSRYGKDPSLKELIHTFDLDEEEVVEVYQQVALQNPYSLDQKIYPEDDSSHALTLKDRIEDPQNKEQRQLIEDQEILLLTLMRMPLRARKVYVMLHNLCDLVQDLEPDYDELKKFFEGPRLKVVPSYSESISV